MKEISFFSLPPRNTSESPFQMTELEGGKYNDFHDVQKLRITNLFSLITRHVIDCNNMNVFEENF